MKMSLAVMNMCDSPPCHISWGMSDSSNTETRETSSALKMGEKHNIEYKFRVLEGSKLDIIFGIVCIFRLMFSASYGHPYYLSVYILENKFCLLDFLFNNTRPTLYYIFGKCTQDSI